MGRALLLDLDRERYADEPFLLCRRLASTGLGASNITSSVSGTGLTFALLTRRRLLCVAAPPSQAAAPALRWSVALEDLLCVTRHAAFPHTLQPLTKTCLAQHLGIPAVRSEDRDLRFLDCEASNQQPSYCRDSAAAQSCCQ